MTSFLLAIGEFHGDDGHRVPYVRQPFSREPDFDVTSVNYDRDELLEREKKKPRSGGSRSMALLGRPPASEGEPGKNRREKETPLAGRRASDTIAGGVYRTVALDAAEVNRW